MKKIIGFDVDGTLVPNIPYSWEEFHRVFSIDRERLDKLYNGYKTGSLTFNDWGILDTELWVEKRIHMTDFERVVRSNFQLANGSIQLLDQLKKNGHVMAIISGSLSIVLKVLIPNYSDYFSHLYMGHLEFDSDGYVKNYYSSKILKNGREYKLGELETVCRNEGVLLTESIFIGDNVNDISALKGAGTGIGFLPRCEEVIQVADVIINENNMLKILDYV